MTRALPEDDGAHVVAGADDVLDDGRARRRARARPGPGPDRGRARVRARAGARAARCRCVLDADGLNALRGAARRPARARRRPTVLTPHEGELGRLLGRSTRRDRGAPARGTRARPPSASARSSCSRATTRSSPQPDGRVAVSPGGAPALATAGTGDVLSRRDRRDARQGHGPVRRAPAPACGCTRCAGSAGGRALHGPDGVVASDVIAALPAARSAGRLTRRWPQSVRDIMDTDPPTVGPEAPVEDVLRLMRDRDDAVVPVVNDGGRCVGIITEADLVIGRGGGRHPPPALHRAVRRRRVPRAAAPLRGAAAQGRRVARADIMTEDPVTIEPTRAPTRPAG